MCRQLDRGYDPADVVVGGDSAGVPVQLDALEGMFHIYATYDGFMPEDARAWKMVEDLVAERLRQVQGGECLS